MRRTRGGWSQANDEPRVSPPVLRVLLSQNYSLAELEELCQKGERPMQHLWGADVLSSAGIDVTVLGSPRFASLRWLSKATRMRFGDFPRQLTLLRAARNSRADVIVCAEMGFARGLGLMRRWRLLRTPLVGVQHPYEPRTPFTRYAAGGFDHVLCLSEAMMAAFSDLPNRDHVAVAHWGTDVNFQGYTPSDGGQVVSTGRTHRDLHLLAVATARAGCQLVIHGAVDAEPSPLRTEKIKAGYGAVLADLASAAVVAIPLRRTDGTFGVTELNDALALGKPVLMTRTRYVDADIEAIGCGRWIDEGDEKGWVTAIEELMADPELRRDMGEKGRHFAESSWNHQLFGAALLQAVDRVSGRGSTRPR